jgi:hypothetical protein
VTAGLTAARQNAQNYNIAQGTLGLNTAKAQADAAQTQATTTERIRHDKAARRTRRPRRRSSASRRSRPAMALGVPA